MKEVIKRILKKLNVYHVMIFLRTQGHMINWFKTFFLNFKWLPFGQARHFPILVGRSVELRNISGEFIIEGKVHFAQFLISFYYTPVDSKKNPVVVYNAGKIIVRGNVYVRSGVKLWVESNGELVFEGENAIGANTILACYKRIEWGYFSMCSWNCQIYDTNFHFFRDIQTGEITKRSSFVKIGRDVWIGNSVHITKGARLPNGCIVSNRSVVSRSYNKEGNNIMIAGHPAVKVLEGYEKIKGEFYLDSSAENIIKSQMEN